MTRRIATLVPVLAAAGIAVAGCGGGDPSASGPTPPVGSQSSSPRTGVSVAPSNAPPAAGSGSAGSPGSPGSSGATGATGATGDDMGGANGSGGGGSSTVALPAPNGNSGLGSLPVGFPLPSGTMLGRIAVRSTDITAPMEVPDGEQAAVFWKKELPAAGYRISSTVVKEVGDIKFIGKGCKRGSDIAISGEHVAFLCRR